MRIEVSDEAQDELLGILRYGYDMFGEDASEAYLRGFDNAFALIVVHPAIGTLHDHVRPPIRSLPYGSHRIFYDVFEDFIVVQRVLHKAMDAERHL
ncbi:type II toxin-antitoxin system RelE/ParE family toxin [Sphingomonas aliaeris]|uniref:Type II toxin-antitoxin system RelE/ParE family toxin n=1 Tax=Sphingomonas aliaeris TaxID=2759526 RepID=A0A974NUQ5_9SPHN|nr:type II toxin-antitoxin system RelE/ParE family toxin [Sphingomonas aliaeris]QQV77252.1 type II toxin-antitoxin system RelE/ParE family toxin [Sphingomonas aliaeris]